MLREVTEEAILHPDANMHENMQSQVQYHQSNTIQSNTHFSGDIFMQNYEIDDCNHQDIVNLHDFSIYDSNLLQGHYDHAFPCNAYNHNNTQYQHVTNNTSNNQTSKNSHIEVKGNTTTKQQLQICNDDGNYNNDQDFLQLIPDIFDGIELP